MLTNTLVELKNITVCYGESLALNALSFTLRQGEHSALFGPNGSGKSTLLGVIRARCFPVPSQISSILWYPDGKPDSSPLAARQLSARVSIAQTELYLRSRWKICGLDLVISGLYDTPILYGKPAANEVAKAVELAQKLGISDLIEKNIDTMSKMQLLLLLFARACINRPKVLLLDECLDNLDGCNRAQVLDFLEILSHETTLLAATHREDNLPKYITRGVYMENGRIVKDMPLGQGRTVNYEDSGNIQKARNNKFGERPLFRLQNASVIINGSPVLYNINWEMFLGEHWMIMGAAGSGKSVLLRLLAGEYYPTFGGSIERVIPGSPEPLQSITAIRRHIRLVSCEMQIVYNYEITSEKYVLSGLVGASIFWREPNCEERMQAKFWMQKLGVLHLEQRLLHTLSTGQQRKLTLARALIDSPRVLLLDDPFSGLDPDSRSNVIALLRSMVVDNSIQTIMITRYPEDIIVPSSLQAVMLDGRLILPGA